MLMLKPPDFPRPVPNDIAAAPDGEDAFSTEKTEFHCGRGSSENRGGGARGRGRRRIQ